MSLCDERKIKEGLISNFYMANENVQPLGAVNINTGHGAIGAFAGYHYQWFYFMLRMFKMNEKGEAVDFEVRDDVAADVNGSLTFFN